MSLKEIIHIADWFVTMYERARGHIKNLWAWWQEKQRIRRERKIRDAVDRMDTDTIDNILRDIVKKRQDRRDGS